MTSLTFGVVSDQPEFQSPLPTERGKIDFVNGVYTFDGVSYDAEDIFTGSPLDIIPGVGLKVLASDFVELGDPFGAKLKTGDFAIGVDFIVTTINSNGAIFGVSDVSLNNYAWLTNDNPHAFDGDPPNAPALMGDDAGDNGDRFDRLTGRDFTDIGAGRHGMAWIRTDPFSQMSLDGSTVQENHAKNIVFGVGVSRCRFMCGGGFSGEYTIFRELRIWDSDALPVDDLPVVSDVPNRTPGNDFFASAQALTSAVAVDGATWGCSKETGEPDHAGFTGGASIWYTYTPASNGFIDVTLSDVDEILDPLLAVYAGSAVDALSELSSTNGTSLSTVPVSAGVPYFIAIDSKNGKAKGGQFSLTCTFSADTNLLQFKGHYKNTGSNVSALTYADCDFGAPAADRLIVVAVATIPWLNNDASPHISSMTIGGVSATMAHDDSAGPLDPDGGSNSNAAIWYATVPSDATGDVVINYAQGVYGSAVAVYRATGLSTNVPAHTSGAATSDNLQVSLSGSIDIPTNGTGLHVAMNWQVHDAESYDSDPSGWTLDYFVPSSDVDLGGSAFGFRRRTVTVSETASLDYTWTGASDMALSAASWAP
jgi:hypothetical protein